MVFQLNFKFQQKELLKGEICSLKSWIKVATTRYIIIKMILIKLFKFIVYDWELFAVLRVVTKKNWK